MAAPYITEWSHTRIVGVVPPGCGTRALQLSIRRVGLHWAAPSTPTWLLRYATPLLTSLTLPDAGAATEGGSPATLTGEHLCPGANWNESEAAAAATDAESGAFQTPLALDVAPYVPLATPRLLVGPYACVVGVVGASTTATGCWAAASYADDTTLSLPLPPGVGLNKTVVLRVEEGGSVAAVSNALRYSYATPVMTTLYPAIVYMTDVNADRTVDIAGTNFGNPELADAQAWTAEERATTAALGAIPCVSVSAIRTAGVTSERCALGSPLPVGEHNASMTVVGQVAVTTAAPILLVCSPGYYGRTGEVCAACPTVGARCDGFLFYAAGGDDARNSYPRPLAGFYNLNGTTADACPPSSGVAGRDVCIVACEPMDACLRDNLCAAGYVSPAPYYRCATCAPGYFRRNGTCMRCPTSPYAVLVVFLVMFVAAACVGFVLNLRGVNLAVLSIGVDFFQVVSLFGASRIKFPAIVRDILSALSAFNLNIEVVAPECFVPDVTYRQKFLAVVALPVAVAGIVAALAAVHAVWRAAYRFPCSRREVCAGGGPLLSTWITVLYFFYRYVTRTLLDVFNCVPTTPPDGRLYLQPVFEECGVPGGTQRTLLPYAVAGFLLYTAGYPLVQLVWLVHRRETVLTDQLLRSLHLGDDRLTGPDTLAFRHACGRAYYQFRPQFAPYWVSVILLRKFGIAATAVLFSQNAAFQMAACLLVVFLAYTAQVRAKPYMSRANVDDVLPDMQARAATSTLYARVLTHGQEVQDRGHRVPLPSRLMPRRAAEAAMAAVAASRPMTAHAALTRTTSALVRWLYDYNTVEAVLLFAAVVVCLMAIMYQAQGANPYYEDPHAQDSITVVLLVAIAAGTLYFVAVVVADLSSMLASARAGASGREPLPLSRTRRAPPAPPGKAAVPTAALPPQPSRVATAGGGSGGGGGGGADAGITEVVSSPLFIAHVTAAAGADTELAVSAWQARYESEHSRAAEAASALAVAEAQVAALRAAKYNLEHRAAARPTPRFGPGGVSAGVLSVVRGFTRPAALGGAVVGPPSRRAAYAPTGAATTGAPRTATVPPSPLAAPGTPDRAATPPPLLDVGADDPHGVVDGAPSTEQQHTGADADADADAHVRLDVVSSDDGIDGGSGGGGSGGGSTPLAASQVVRPSAPAAVNAYANPLAAAAAATRTPSTRRLISRGPRAGGL